MLQQRRQLLTRGLDLHETIPQCLLSWVLPEIPTQVFTCHSNTGRIAVERVQVFEVGAHNITDFFQRQICAQFSVREEKIDFIEDPWPTLSGAADQDAVAAGVNKNLFCTLRRVDVAVGKYRNF
jgi:hypothetical protein